MKWLIGVFAALMVTTAQADESLKFGIQSNGHNACAWYQGSFNQDGYRRAKNDSRPVVACELTDGVGATCWLSGHGIKGLPNTLKMVGNFLDRGNSLVTETDAGVIRMRVFCDQESGCFRINVWDINDAVGFSCDMSKFVAPPKPAPRPPELLRKPDAKDAPPAFKPLEDGTYKL